MREDCCWLASLVYHWYCPTTTNIHSPPTADTIYAESSHQASVDLSREFTQIYTKCSIPLQASFQSDILPSGLLASFVRRHQYSWPSLLSSMSFFPAGFQRGINFKRRYLVREQALRMIQLVAFNYSYKRHHNELPSFWNNERISFGRVQSFLSSAFCQQVASSVLMPSTVPLWPDLGICRRRRRTDTQTSLVLRW